MGNDIKNKDYWNTRYENNDTHWDIGYPSPAIKEYIDQLEDDELNILIPGCGNAHEAGYLLSKGFKHLTVIDIAPTLTASLREKFHSEAGRTINIINGDFFAHQGQYDLILEQTFLSALYPSLRAEYALQMHHLLKPRGKLVGILFNKHFDENPPYGGTEEEYRVLFEKHFDILKLEPCYNSIDRRANSEVFIKLINK